MSTMAIMGRKGDTKVIWSKDNAEEVQAARNTFNDLVRGKGFAAYSVKAKTGEKHERIREFDPNAESIIIVPPMVGG